MNPRATIGRAVKRERERAELSLSALASRAGLAKSTLSQLEAGNGNPNIETMWALASALDLPFSRLFEVSEPRGKLIRQDAGQAVTTSEGAFAAVLLDAASPSMRRDLYRTVLEKDEPRAARPHSSGTVEHVIVCEGEAKVGPDENAEILRVGDYYRYPADVPHGYEALSDTALLIIVMESQR